MEMPSGLGSTTVVTLDPETIRELAAAIATTLNVPMVPSIGWVTAEVVAEHLAVDINYVYEHASALGARRLGDGPKARLRFRLDAVDSALCLTDRNSSDGEIGRVEPRSRRRRTSRLGTEVQLLPIRGPKL